MLPRPVLAARSRPLAWDSGMRRYRLYGLRIESNIPLPCVEQHWRGKAHVTLMSVSDQPFSDASGDQRPPSSDEWFWHRALPDGRHYLCWTGLFEFLISADGHCIWCRALAGASLESFQTYLASHVLSFALLKQGIEPLHATALAVEGHAIAFLGDCGYGKSTLGAVFLCSGHQIITDDLLALERLLGRAGNYTAHPGPPRLKLFRHVADALLRDRQNGVPMNPQTKKLIIPLAVKATPTKPVALKTLYILAPYQHTEQVRIRRMTARQACLALIRNTFNTMVVSHNRLRQQFHFAASLASDVPVKSLAFPRGLERLPAVRDAILADLE